MGHVLATYKDPNSMPDIFRGPIFNPLDGFPEGRKRRQSILTEDEMIAAGLRSHERDYCAHILIASKNARRNILSQHFFVLISSTNTQIAKEMILCLE
uniref:NADH dehydrogenase (Ubiquinone) 1 beta subcomplex 7 n=1 Tax=Schistosoma japonicum TaxID=6182 RepID=C1L8P0_SCHJA|nr:NADH dehydrogenase (ubiquinone) 1 beta subcomplex 7 [Schistosoma japonicum]